MDLVRRDADRSAAPEFVALNIRGEVESPEANSDLMIESAFAGKSVEQERNGDANSSSTGAPEEISKAEQLVNEVLAEADAPQPKSHKNFPSTSPKTPTCLLPINSSTSLCTPTMSFSPSFRLKNIFMLLLLFTHLQLSSLVVGWKCLFSKLSNLLVFVIAQ